MQKKKIVYISPYCYTDVDFPILKHLIKKYEIKWIVIYDDPCLKPNPKYTETDVVNYAGKYDIDCSVYTRKGRIRGIRNIFFNFRLLMHVKREKYDAIYIESFNDIYFNLISFILLKRSKVVIGIHDVVPHAAHSTALKDLGNTVQRAYYKYYHLFSDTQAAIFRQLYPRKYCVVIQSALKYMEGSVNITNKTDMEEPAKFLFWGVIRYNKGLDILIKAAEALFEKCGCIFELVIAGECDDWGTYEKYIIHKEIFHTDIRHIPNDEVNVLLSSAHYLVLPYRDVTQSGPMYFALNANLPVIASDLDGFKEYIVDEENGFLFRTGDIPSLAGVMEKALRLSSNEYSELKSRQKRYAESRFSINTIIEGYENLFDKIISLDM